MGREGDLREAWGEEEREREGDLSEAWGEKERARERLA